MESWRETLDIAGPLAVTLARAAELLSIGRTTLYEHAKAGNVRTIMICADRRVPMEEVQRLAREGLPALPRRRKQADAEAA